MANRPTVAQQQLFEDILEGMSNSMLTRSTLATLTPAQRKKVLETQKLQSILIQSQTQEEITSEFSKLTWSSIINPRNVLYTYGCTDVWSHSPLSWFDPIRPNEVTHNVIAPLDNAIEPNLEPIWLVHYAIAHEQNVNAPTNSFIKHLVSQGATGDMEILSTAFGGVERLLKLHDIILAYSPCTAQYDWDLVTKLTTWKTSSEVEDTIFAAFLNTATRDTTEIEKVLKRLPSLQINWAKEFPVNAFRTPKPHFLSLSALVCAAGLKTPPRTKHIKNLYMNAINAITSFETDQQIQAIKDVLSLTHGFRHNGGLSSFTDASKQLLPYLSAPAQKTWSSTLISEVMVSYPYELADRVHNILRILPEKKHFDMEHLQLFHKYIDRFLKIDYYSGEGSKAMGLFKLWKNLRPYVTDQVLAVVDLLSSDLLVLSTPSEIKEWKTNFNLHVNLKPQLLNQASKMAQRKM